MKMILVMWWIIGELFGKNLVNIVAKYLDGRKSKLIWIQLGSAAVISTELAPNGPWLYLIMITLTHDIVAIVVMTARPFPAGHLAVGRGKGMVESTPPLFCIEKSRQNMVRFHSVIILIRDRVGISLMKCGIVAMLTIVIIIMTTTATRDESPLWRPRAWSQSPHASTRGPRCPLTQDISRNDLKAH